MVVIMMMMMMGEMKPAQADLEQDDREMDKDDYRERELFQNSSVLCWTGQGH